MVTRLASEPNSAVVSFVIPLQRPYKLRDRADLELKQSQYLPEGKIFKNLEVDTRWQKALKELVSYK